MYNIKDHNERKLNTSCSIKFLTFNFKSSYFFQFIFINFLNSLYYNYYA